MINNFGISRYQKCIICCKYAWNETIIDTSEHSIINRAVVFAQKEFAGCLKQSSLDMDFSFAEDYGFEVRREKEYKTNKHVFLYRKEAL